MRADLTGTFFATSAADAPTTIKPDNAKMTATAPVAVVICGALDKALPGEAHEYWIQDAAAATENFLLAVHALGLGAVWTGVHPISERIKILKETLKLP